MTEQKHTKIALWVMLIATLYLAISIFVVWLRVSAVIFFISALGILFYHVLIKGELNISNKIAMQRLLLILCISMVFCLPFYWFLPALQFKIVACIILSLGGIAGIYWLSTHISSRHE